MDAAKSVSLPPIRQAEKRVCWNIIDQISGSKLDAMSSIRIDPCISNLYV